MVESVIGRVDETLKATLMWKALMWMFRNLGALTRKIHLFLKVETVSFEDEDDTNDDGQVVSIEKSDEKVSTARKVTFGDRSFEVTRLLQVSTRNT